METFLLIWNLYLTRGDTLDDPAKSLAIED